MCNVRLALNGSDYETVKILEDKDIIPDIEISNLKTDEGMLCCIIMAVVAFAQYSLLLYG